MATIATMATTTKFRLPDDPAERDVMWRRQLNRVRAAQKDVLMESIALGQEAINMELRMAAGEELGTERSALRKREFENRMKQLCLAEQKTNLEGAISGPEP